MQLVCGIHNVPVYTLQTRRKLGIGYKALAKYIGCRPLDVYLIEQGKVNPPVIAVKRLIWLDKYASLTIPLFSSLSSIRSLWLQIWAYLYRQWILYFYLRLTNKMDINRQLYLPLRWFV